MQLQQNSMYHSLLRVAALVCALVLVFESGLLHDSTRMMASQTHLYLANAIGMTASVQPTELNQITAELTRKENELAAREAALREREISVDIVAGGGTDNTTYVLASILFILLVLIILNYTLDYLRLREFENTKPV
jgi:hypothetical protein